MITRHTIQSCCGGSNLVFETDKPIRKYQVKTFRDAGYLVPDNWYQAGIFYVQNKKLIATASYGANKINVRCNGQDCPDSLNSFSALLEQAINS